MECGGAIPTLYGNFFVNSFFVNYLLNILGINNL